jgi:hypothetical protein
MPATTAASTKVLRGLGDHIGVVALVTFGADYTNVGQVPPVPAELPNVDAIVPLGTTQQATGQLVEYIPSSGVLKLRVAATGVATATSDQSAAVVPCLFIGGGLSDA